MAGRKTYDETGEKRSEKFTLYVTPSMLADIRDICALRGVSVVSYITELVNRDLDGARDKLDAFREMRKDA